MKVLRYSHLAFAIPLLILLFCYLLASASFLPSNELTHAITIDFIVTAPLAYFFLIRKTSIPNYTAISFFVVATFVASYILPENHQSLIGTVKVYLIPMVEVGILSIMIVKFYRITKGFRKHEKTQHDFFETLKLACNESLPAPLSSLLATEISVIYYTFNFSKVRPLKEHEFSYHKKSGSALVLGTLLGLILVETFAIHIMVTKWNGIVAWILSILSLYTCFQIVAMVRSFGRRPASINKFTKTLNLKYGFFCQAEISIDDIDHIEETARSLPDNMNMVKFSPIESLDNHNLIIFLKKPCLVRNVYGRNKTVNTLAIYIDQKKAFLNMIQNLS